MFVKLLVATSALAAALPAAAQAPEEGIRQLWNQEILQKRPPAKTPPAVAKKPVVYKPVATAAVAAPKTTAGTPTTASAVKPPKPSGAAVETVMGVTLWRLRKPKAADDPSSRLLILGDDEDASTELVPERVEGDTALAVGDKVRLTIEVPRTGYLYLIDREQYVDGTTSDPYLIYPNVTTRPGDNLVAAGRLLEIPDSRDKPNHFKLQRSRKDQVSELFSVLVTPEPIPNLDTSKRILKLSQEQYKEWETKFGVEVERFELVDGAGAASTRTELQGGVLTQDDPMPQTLYKITCEPGKAILVKVPVKIKSGP